MVLIRVTVSLLFFIAACALLVSLLLQEFNWVILIAAIACFFLAYWIWPNRSNGRKDRDSDLLDWLEFIIELPVDLLLWLPRILIRLLSKGDGIDF